MNPTEFKEHFLKHCKIMDEIKDVEVKVDIKREYSLHGVRSITEDLILDPRLAEGMAESINYTLKSLCTFHNADVKPKTIYHSGNMFDLIVEKLPPKLPVVTVSPEEEGYSYVDDPKLQKAVLLDDFSQYEITAYLKVFVDFEPVES